MQPFLFHGISALVIAEVRAVRPRGSETLREVSWVIFDEVHYMQDRERGVVWEETIIFLPKDTRMVFLSATLSNAPQFTEWVAKLRAHPCHVVYTDFRPTPLQHYMCMAGASEGLHLVGHLAFHDPLIPSPPPPPPPGAGPWGPFFELTLSLPSVQHHWLNLLVHLCRNIHTHSQRPRILLQHCMCMALALEGPHLLKRLALQNNMTLPPLPLPSPFRMRGQQGHTCTESHWQMIMSIWLTVLLAVNIAPW